MSLTEHLWAAGGTLFLEDVGALPPAAQLHLLRALEEGSFQRVGGEEAPPLDVRIVASSRRDLGPFVQEGRFRADLSHRLGVFPLRLPALRERPADIAPLAERLAQRAGLRLHGVELRLDDVDRAALEGYPWPGNARELAAVIERAAILGAGRRLEIAGALGVATSRTRARTPYDLYRGAIDAALAQARGRIEGPGGAAERLGINPHTLRSRIRRLGIDWRRYRGG